MSPEASRRLQTATVLGAACAVSALLLFPYLAATFPAVAQSKLPMGTLAVVQAIQALILCTLLAWAGLHLGKDIGLGAPLLERKPDARLAFGRAAVMGLVTGLVLLAIDHFGFMPLQPEAIRNFGGHVARWKGFLAAFYGGIAEEVELRLFVMTLVAWLLTRIAGRRGVVYVASALIAAVVFGAGHLPAVKSLAPLTAIVVARVVLLNAAAGTVFGLVYWKRGLEHAMVAHFCADLILHVAAG